MIPYQSRNFLDNLCEDFPKTPHRACKAIQGVLFSFGYGCDENLMQKRFARWPHQVEKYINCNDAGIFSYLMAKKLGLDCSLARIENFQDTGQSHLTTIVRSSTKDYSIHRDNVQEFSLDPSKKVFYLDELDIAKMIKTATIEDFLSTGQMLSACVRYEKAFSYPFYFYINRALKLTGDGLLRRKTFELPGLFVSYEFQNDEHRIFFHEGINSLKLIKPRLIEKLMDYEPLDIAQLPKTVSEKYYRAFIRIWQVATIVDDNAPLKFTKKFLDCVKKSRSGFSEEEIMHCNHFDGALDINYRNRKKLGYMFRNAHYRETIMGNMSLIDYATGFMSKLQIGDVKHKKSNLQRRLIRKVEKWLSQTSKF